MTVKRLSVVMVFALVVGTLLYLAFETAGVPHELGLLLTFALGLALPITSHFWDTITRRWDATWRWLNGGDRP